jgi:hypothetical protein
VATALVCSLAAASRAADKTEIAFKFENERKAAYDLSIDLDVTTGALKAGRREESKTTTNMTMTMNVTENVPEDGAAKLAVTFEDLKLTQKISAPAGEINVEVSGADVVVKRGGSPVIDTKKNVGKDLAAGLLAQFAFVGKEGTLTVGKAGALASVEGPDEFTRFMDADLKAGLFVLRAPAEAIGLGESWSVERSIAKLRGLDLGTSPIVVKTTFKLEGVEDADGKKIAKVTVKSELKDNEDLSAKGVGGAFDGQTILIETVERDATGTVEFDVNDGFVVSSTLDVDMSLKLTVTVDKEEITTTLAGTAKVASKRN